MQIVIDIDDNLYTRLFDNGVTDAADLLKAHIAIRKGTVLPKGHGQVDILGKITNLFNRWNNGEIDDNQYHFQMQNLLLFGKELLEVENE